jgi:hypothetical protein
MNENSDDMFIDIKKLKENVKNLEVNVGNINTHFTRIEEKVNYIINILESFLAEDDEDEDNEEEYLSNEGWMPDDSDSWKNLSDEDF